MYLPNDALNRAVTAQNTKQGSTGGGTPTATFAPGAEGNMDINALIAGLLAAAPEGERDIVNQSDLQHFFNTQEGRQTLVSMLLSAGVADQQAEANWQREQRTLDAAEARQDASQQKKRDAISGYMQRGGTPGLLDLAKRRPAPNLTGQGSNEAARIGGSPSGDFQQKYQAMSARRAAPVAPAPATALQQGGQ